MELKWVRIENQEQMQAEDIHKMRSLQSPSYQQSMFRLFYKMNKCLAMLHQRTCAVVLFRIRANSHGCALSSLCRMDYYGYIWGWFRGQKTHVIRDTELSKTVLKESNTKGQYLEASFARAGWLPSLSVESEDNERWQRLRKGFNVILQHTDFRRELPPIVKEVCEEFVASFAAKDDGVINAKIITQCVASILVQLLFDQKLSSSDLEQFWEARNEWAKTLSVKGEPNEAIRSKFWIKISELVKMSKYDHLREDNKVLKKLKLSDLEWISCFFQPWIMSPMINVVDIIATAEEYFPSKPPTEAILLALDQRHPFPVLERELSNDIFFNNEMLAAAGQHVFILTDIPHIQPSRHGGIRFGEGERKCPGQSVAILLIGDMLSQYRKASKNSKIRFIPGSAHLWSGHTNDDTTSLYRIWAMIRQLFQPTFVNSNQSDGTNANIVCSAPQPSWHHKYITHDRWNKFYLGTIRLSAFILVLAWLSQEYSTFLRTFTHQLTSLSRGSVVVALAIGAIGAITNVSLYGKAMNLVLCIGTLVGVLCYYYYYVMSKKELAIVAGYAVKTAVGDTLAGKSDQKAYAITTIIVLLCSIAIAWWVLDNDYSSINMQRHAQQWGGIVWLILAQWLCEWCDRVLESSSVMFRHRYTYEVSTLLLMWGIYGLSTTAPAVPPILGEVLVFDLIAVWGYRASNAVIIWLNWGD